MYEKLQMSKKEDVTASPKPIRIKSANLNAVRRIIGMIQDTMNPFDSRLDPDHLYNNGTGKSASVDTEKFLIGVAAIGEDKTLENAWEDPSRFEKRITRQKLHTFASDAGKCKLRAKDGKLVAACLVRDLYGSTLYHSLEQKVDMTEVLNYPWQA